MISAEDREGAIRAAIQWVQGAAFQNLDAAPYVEGDFWDPYSSLNRTERRALARLANAVERVEVLRRQAKMRKAGKVRHG